MFVPLRLHLKLKRSNIDLNKSLKLLKREVEIARARQARAEERLSLIRDIVSGRYERMTEDERKALQ